MSASQRVDEAKFMPEAPLPADAQHPRGKPVGLVFFLHNRTYIGEAAATHSDYFYHLLLADANTPE